MTSDQTEQTIVAPATAVGEGGIGIIRVSGTSAETCLQRFFRPGRKIAVLESHRLYHGRLVDQAGCLVDEVMAVIMRRPKSYTGEDVVEVHCHGGHLVMRRILDLFVQAGARLAHPGEFTQRAFLNGRIDLTRAEAVIDVIRSRSEAACRLALRQMDGALSSVLFDLRNRLLEHLAFLEAHIDFPEEDIAPPEISRLVDAVDGVRADISSLLAGFDSGRVLREGVNVLILGRPNVGKSSLLNALLGESRAIVTDIPGTTRDTVEENLVIGGLPIRLIDTAGVHDTGDPVEAEGVRRAQSKCSTADLVLLVIDGSTGLGKDDLLAQSMCSGRNVVLVVNKSDRGLVAGETLEGLPQVVVSAKTGEGLDRLRDMISDLFIAGGDVSESTLLSDRRHRQALLRAGEALDRFVEAAADAPDPEFLALDLKDALVAIGEITGETTPDEILDLIFSRFCVGK